MTLYRIDLVGKHQKQLHIENEYVTTIYTFRTRAKFVQLV